MNVKKYLQLEDVDKQRVCQDLSMYNKKELLIFKEVEELFKDEYSSIGSIEAIKCGMAPMLGPHNCIKIFVPRGQKPVRLPKYFQGFPIFKILESQYKTYNELIDR